MSVWLPSGLYSFIERVSDLFELVVFTAATQDIADPVIDTIDPNKRIIHRLYRESCVNVGSLFVKDLDLLGRAPESTVIIDNSPSCYMLQPDQAIPIESWFQDADDHELQTLIPLLEELAASDEDVSTALARLVPKPLSRWDGHQ